MKILNILKTGTTVLIGLCLIQCSEEKKAVQTIDTTLQAEKKELPPKQPLSKDFKAYWYAGDAEITSYRLEQARYGEIREGNAVLIYVTEPFLEGKQVKADNRNPDNIPVLKLNATKNYLTGIYPYSIMSSTFYPVYNNQHALKSSFSAQEWCGQVYAQLNNRADFEVISHSYFESEADQQLVLPKTHLENEIWNIIRINPESLPLGNIEILPSLEYFRLKHKEVKAMQAKATLDNQGEVSTYTIKYIDDERELSISFNTEFPYEINGWKETFISGFGKNASKMTSKATQIRKLKTPYWKQNSNSYTSLRDSLGL